MSHSMFRWCRYLCVVLAISLFSGVTRAGEDSDESSVEKLWSQWRGGDDEAYRRLIELGPETRVLATRILNPEGRVFPEWPSGVEANLLDAMRADAVPEIVKAIERILPGKDRLTFIQHLETLGRMARPAGDQLMEIALEESGIERLALLRALASAQTKRDFIIPEAMRLLSSAGNSRGLSIPIRGPNRRAALAVELLSKYRDSQARNALVRAMRFHPSPQVRALAIDSLVRAFGSDGTLTDAFIDCLDDRSATLFGVFSSDRVCDGALDSLLQYPTLPSNSAADLIKLLYRQSYEGQWLSAQDVCEAICRCATGDEIAAELVTHKLRPLLDESAYFNGGDSEALRVAAASVVLKWNPKDRSAAELLAKVVREKTDRDFSAPLGGRLPDVRAQAARGFRHLGPAAKEWLPMLHEILERESKTDPHSQLAFATAWTIAKVDPADEICLHVLRETGREELAWRPWTEIQNTLGERAKLLVDIEKTIPQLNDAQFLQNHSHDEWLWKCLQPHDDVVVPIICEHVKSDQVAARIAVCEILGGFQTSNDRVIAALAELLCDARAAVRAAAAEALGQLGPRAAATVPDLERVTQDEFLTVKLAAEDALATIRQTKPK